jgi:hypothetical protein
MKVLTILYALDLPIEHELRRVLMLRLRGFR